jgi:hypothetical protein
LSFVNEFVIEKAMRKEAEIADFAVPGPNSAYWRADEFGTGFAHAGAPAFGHDEDSDV